MAGPAHRIFVTAWQVTTALASIVLASSLQAVRWRYYFWRWPILETTSERHATEPFSPLFFAAGYTGPREMGLLETIITVIVLFALALGVLWCLRRMAPNRPKTQNNSEIQGMAHGSFEYKFKNLRGAVTFGAAGTLGALATIFLLALLAVIILTPGPRRV